MDTVAERQFLVNSMIGSIQMTPEALLRSTLKRRDRLVSDALTYNKEFDSKAFNMARKAGVIGLEDRFDTSFVRGPIVGDFTLPKYPNKRFQKFANGDLKDVDTGEIVYQGANPYARTGSN